IPGMPCVHPLITPPASENWTGCPEPSFHEASNCLPVLYRTPTYWTVTVEFLVATAPVPLIRSLTNRWLGGGPLGTTTVGLCRSAAGTAGGGGGAVKPADGASTMPGAFELLPQA